MKDTFKLFLRSTLRSFGESVAMAAMRRSGFTPTFSSMMRRGFTPMTTRGNPRRRMQMMQTFADLDTGDEM